MDEIGNILSLVADCFMHRLPEGTIHENPQDMKFYDWILVDAKDAPYASFKFHYRNWDQLEALHLIPQNHPRVFESPIRSVNSMEDTGAVTRSSLDGISEDNNDHSALLEDKAPLTATGATINDMLDTGSHPEWCIDRSKDGGLHPGTKSFKHEPNHRSKMKLTSSLSDLSAYTVDNISPQNFNRPLPDPFDFSVNSPRQHERPLPTPPTFPPSRSRSVSINSLDPSVTASLLQYFEGSDSEESDPEVSQAMAIPIPEPSVSELVYTPSNYGDSIVSGDTSSPLAYPSPLRPVSHSMLSKAHSTYSVASGFDYPLTSPLRRNPPSIMPPSNGIFDPDSVADAHQPRSMPGIFPRSPTPRPCLNDDVFAPNNQDDFEAAQNALFKSSPMKHK
jgi:hypothetical protein